MQKLSGTSTGTDINITCSILHLVLEQLLYNEIFLGRCTERRLFQGRAASTACQGTGAGAEIRIPRQYHVVGHHMGGMQAIVELKRMVISYSNESSPIFDCTWIYNRPHFSKKKSL